MDQFKLFYKSLMINLSYKFFKTIEKELICLAFEINRDNGLIFFFYRHQFIDFVNYLWLYAFCSDVTINPNEIFVPHGFV